MPLTDLEVIPATESGIWTPSLLGTVTPGNQTYASERNGWFTKQGQQVFIDLSIAATKDAAINGNIYIGGLPFLIKSASPYVCGFALGGHTGFIFPSGYSQLLLQGVRGTDQITIRFYGSNVNPLTCTHANLGPVVTIRGSMIYLID